MSMKMCQSSAMSASNGGGGGGGNADYDDVQFGEEGRIVGRDDPLPSSSRNYGASASSSYPLPVSDEAFQMELGSLRVGHVKGDKRRTQSREGEPPRKQRITEEKMAARLQNFHISNGLAADEKQPGYYMRRAPQTLQEIDDRLSDSSDDDEDWAPRRRKSAKPVTTGDNRPNTLELSPELCKLIEQQKKAFSPLIRQPVADMQVVLWEPKEDFVTKVARKVLGPMNDRITDVTDNDEYGDGQWMTMDPMEDQTGHIVSHPDSADEHDVLRSSTIEKARMLRKQRNKPGRLLSHNCHPTVKIEELSSTSPTAFDAVFQQKFPSSEANDEDTMECD